MSKRRGEKGEESGPQATEAAEASTKTLLEMFMEQQRAQQEQQREQQRILLALVEQQKEELTQHRKEMAELRAQRDAHEEREAKAAIRLPKPTLQKLGPDDDIEHFLATFERIAKQQEWPAEIWATQLAGLLTGKAMAAYASLNSDAAALYDDVKKAILHRYDVNEEAHRRRFRTDRKRPEESYRNWGDRLRDHFHRWIKDQKMMVEELMVLDQFLAGVPEELRVWLKERKPESLKQAAELADDYSLARSRSTLQRPMQTGAAKLPHQDRSQTSHPPPGPLPKPLEVGRSQTNWRGDKRCFQCGKFGHLLQTCPERRTSAASGSSKALLSEACEEVAWDASSHKYLRRGTLNGRPVQMLVDTGCDRTMVSAKLVKTSRVDKGCKVPVLCAHGDTVFYPTARVKLQTGSWECESRVIAAPNLPVDVLLGRDVYDLHNCGKAHHSLAVVTRSKKSRVTHGAPQPTVAIDAQPLPQLSQDQPSADGVELRGKEDETVAETVEEAETDDCSEDRTGQDGQTGQESGALQATPEQLKLWQQQDPSLQTVRDRVSVDRDERVHFYLKDGLIYRSWHPVDTSPEDVRQCEQLVLPQQCRNLVLRIAHDIPMAGHLGITKTKDRVLQRYYWPGVFKDVADYCRSCEVCQRSQTRRPMKAEMVPMPLISKPFQRIAMDLVGPLPRTQRGNRYILTVCDYATRYPEAIPLSSTEAPRIAKELVGIFARMGIPEEILTDQGTNFMSTMLGEIYQLLQIKRIRTTPYHPQTDGLVERFNGTLKSMLKKFVSRSQKDWDDYLPYLLFAYREVPQETTGFSPFELLFGRKVRGPLDVLKEEWTGEAREEVPVAVHVVEMRDRLQQMADLVQENAQKAQQRQKSSYDRGARPRDLELGQQVLVLLPSQGNRLKLGWAGPYRVIRKVTPVDYEVEMPGRRGNKNVYHINLLKLWHPAPTDINMACLAQLAQLGDDDEDIEDMDIPVTEMPEDNLYPSGSGAEETSVERVVAPSLSCEQKQQLQQVMGAFPTVFQTMPGHTDVVEHEIHVGDVTPIRQRPYRIPYSRRELVKRELDEMMAAGVIQPSTSPWASPIVLVEKKDGGVRFCVDYRRLNQVAKFDAYPMPRVEEMFESIGSSAVISTLDLAKGYWQIPMAADSREKTAFVTPFGLYEFNVMPFGLHNAPATFQRMMNYVLRDCQEFSKAYIDDVVIFSKNWEEHLEHLWRVFSQLQQAGLTAKLKKCYFGGNQVHYLGHVIGGGRVQPEPGKIKAVQDYPRPVTKKDIRAFLGLVGYYRRFIPNFASIAVPLTDLTKKRQPQQVEWNDAQEAAFKKLQSLLITTPILAVANPAKPYTLQTDASDKGLGAVLSQTDEGGDEHPVAYASRKLLPREVNYSTIEKECLAIVWALQFFHTYLYGQTFVIQTDHRPLAWLHRMRNTNPRLTRWSLIIQPYMATMTQRCGKENGNADALSRGALEIEPTGMTSSHSHGNP